MTVACPDCVDCLECFWMRRLVPVAAIIAVLFGACGGDDTLGVGRELDRCSVVSADEAAQWIGAPVQAAPSDDVDGEPSPVTCLYEGANAVVLVQIRDGEVFFAEKGSASRIGEDVDGLGEDAYTDGTKVSFLQSDWSVSVSQIIGLVEGEDLLEMAQLISERLPE